MQRRNVVVVVVCARACRSETLGRHGEDPEGGEPGASEALVRVVLDPGAVGRERDRGTPAGRAGRRPEKVLQPENGERRDELHAAAVPRQHRVRQPERRRVGEEAARRAGAGACTCLLARPPGRRRRRRWTPRVDDGGRRRLRRGRENVHGGRQRGRARGGTQAAGTLCRRGPQGLCETNQIRVLETRLLREDHAVSRVSAHISVSQSGR